MVVAITNSKNDSRRRSGMAQKGAWNFRSIRRSAIDSEALPKSPKSPQGRGNFGQFNQSQMGLTLGSFHPTTQDTCAEELFGFGFSSDEENADGEQEKQEDSTSRSPRKSRKRRIRRGFIDGREIEFELQEDVTQKPKTDRKTRLEHQVKNINVEASGLETRVRLWLMQFSIISISALYLGCFITLNMFFALLWYLQEDKCCDDPDHTFAQVFDFAIQTSTTIGYGGYVPVGRFSNFLVAAMSFTQLTIGTVYAGLLFLKFVTPTAKIEFSDILTLHNVNGMPCLVARIGNCDGRANVLTDIHARLTYTYYLQYKDEHGKEVGFGQTETLELTSDKRHHLDEIWTVRHVLDETSPLYGLNFDTFPGNAIRQFRVFVNATQDVTKTSVSAQTGYMVEDVLIGHRFQEQTSYDEETRTVTCDYSKMNATVPHPVWYPISTDNGNG